MVLCSLKSFDIYSVKKNPDFSKKLNKLIQNWVNKLRVEGPIVIYNLV